MPSSVYFQAPQRGNGLREKGRTSNGLPTFSSAVQEKLHSQPRIMSWMIPVSLSIPGIRNRRLRLLVPNYRRFHLYSVARWGKTKGPFILYLAFLAMVFGLFALGKRFGTHKKQWPLALSPGDPPTLVFRREDLQRIWKWEITSGHYPSAESLPEQIGLTSPPLNPALPARKKPTIPSRFRPPPGPFATDTVGVGPKRTYLDLQSQPPNVAYPPRPVPGSIADMDVVMKHCDFSQQKYVRDCLEVLRVGGGLDNGNRMRRGKTDDWKYVYVESGGIENMIEPTSVSNFGQDAAALGPQSERDNDPEVGLSKRRGAEWEGQIVFPAPVQRQSSSNTSPCDDEYPRLFHMFWTGPFTDKPYLALLSFLYTQNVGLQQREYAKDSPVCRPKFWLWINPGPAAAVPNPSATRDMFDQLKSNPWAAPFLHPRFKDVIQFKLWNTTEQLDGIPELKDEWRALKDTLFNSGGHIINVPVNKQGQDTGMSSASDITNGTAEVKPSIDVGKGDEDDMLNRTGSKSSSSYDRLSVILSDMARFVLCHRFGGIYLDADTIFLRDWEEMWGWQGAFAYRWSRLERYNTAVLHLNKGSALGTFLFRTALKNGLDFHPMTVSRYLKDAYLEALLLRLPDALFDSAWLNTEYYQRERPPQPYFYEFGDFFDTPVQNSAAPQALGFDGFFKGAYSYHFHNFWWKPFDPSRNWPDLGPRFLVGERAARAAASLGIGQTDIGASASAGVNDVVQEGPVHKADSVEDDKRDLDWATVLKRTFEAYIRGERPNMYGEWIEW